MKKVLIGKKTEIFIICSILALVAIFMIRVVVFLLEPFEKTYNFEVKQNSSYEIFNTDEARYITKKSKKEIIKYFKEHNIKIKAGMYYIFYKDTPKEIIDKFNFVIDNFDEEDIQKLKDAYGINLLETSEIYSFEKKKVSTGTMYSIKIKNVSDMDYYRNCNSDLFSVSPVLINESHLIEEDISCKDTDSIFYPDKIEISNTDKEAITDYAKNIENLFNELAEKH